jgi:DNA-binding transcriptional LysR family regulator
MPELRRLRYFLAVAEERNFTRAAERLHIAQPALSRQVRQLEEELGARLLIRTSHSVEPTEAGRLLMERGAELVEQAEAVWRDVRSLAAGEQGGLSLGYGTSAGYDTAPELLAAMADRFPGVTVATRLLSTAEIVAGVTDGTLDAGLVRCPPPTPDLVRTLIRLEPQGVILPDGHRLADRDRVDAAELDGEPVLLHPREANPGHYDAIADILARAGATPKIVLRRLSFDAGHAPVAAGEAVAVVGESARPGLPAGLRWLPLSPAATVDIRLLTRGREHRPTVGRLLRVAADTARARGWLRGSSDADLGGTPNGTGVGAEGATG